MKGCVFCGQDYTANQRHIKEEVNNSVNKLKKKHPQVLLTIEGLTTVVNMVVALNYDDERNKYLKWVDDGDENNG